MQTHKLQTEDVVGSLLEMAYRDQLAIQNAVGGLDRSQKKLDAAASGLSTTVAAEVRASLNASIDNAAKTLLKHFDDANVEAVRATTAYREAYENSKFHFAMWGLAVTALAMTALTILAWLFLPSLDEIQRRRTERDALAEEIAWLHLSTQADIGECKINNKKNRRLCARIDPQFTTGTTGYYVIAKK